jgi:acyl carrier protein
VKDEITRIILRIAEEANASLDPPIEVEKGAAAPLFGAKGVLDSMALVQLTVEIETAVEDELGVSVVLADERAMSQHRSPFLTVGSLADYIDALIRDERAAQR